jgi:hypothetical protein
MWQTSDQQNQDTSDVSSFRSELRSLLGLLIQFAKNPVQGIQSIPRLSWPAIFSLQAGSAMISGALVGLIEENFLDFLIGIFIFPASSLALSLIFGFFIYYYFSFIQGTKLEFRRLYAVVVFANLPYFILHSVAGFLPPVDLIGFAFASILLIVGLVEQFNLERRRVIQLVLALYFLFFIIWGATQVLHENQSTASRSKSASATDTLTKFIDQN